MALDSHHYMKIAEVVATASSAVKKKVGAVLVKDRNIISMGYNGTPSGSDNTCEDINGKTKPEVLHAESNAILKCASEGISTKGSTLYLTYSPCIDCSKLIMQANIKEVIFKEHYKDNSGLLLLKKAGIKANKLDGL